MSWYRTSSEPARRKVFVSYCQRDRTEVESFVKRWTETEQVFIPKALGISDTDDFIDSDNPDYVMGQIRKLYLQDSSVTIVLLGTCTHSRRYVDWELKATLRQGEDLPNGLLGILLPSGGSGVHLPPRFQANWEQSEAKCYARYRVPPSSADILRTWIEDAYQARTSRSQFISNSADMMKYNAKCKVHEITH